MNPYLIEHLFQTIPTKKNCQKTYKEKPIHLFKYKDICFLWVNWSYFTVGLLYWGLLIKLRRFLNYLLIMIKGLKFLLKKMGHKFKKNYEKKKLGDFFFFFWPY
jgi:hypothetical protein